MATYTSNYGWTKPSGSDNVDISVLNDNLDDQDSTIHDAFLNMAPPFSESSTYAVDDIVLYGTGLYKCHTAVVTPGSWTGSTNWQVYKLSEGGSGGGGTSDYSALNNKPKINGVELSGNKTTGDLGINADNVMMSDGVTSVEDALDELKGYRVLNSVTADGIKTYKELINALFDGVVIDNNQTIIVKLVNTYYHMMYNSTRYKEFCTIMVENGHMKVRDLNYDNQLTGTHMEESDTTVSGTTFNYLSNTAVTQGYVLTLLAR